MVIHAGRGYSVDPGADSLSGSSAVSPLLGSGAAATINTG